LNDLLHTSQISSKWQFASFYKTGVIRTADGSQSGRRMESKELCYQMGRHIVVIKKG